MERLFYDNGYFITLTYNDDNLPLDCGVSYKDADYFIDELRKLFIRNNIGFSYYLMSEYGGRSLRPHYHFHLLTDAPLSFVSQCVSKLWTKGFIKYGRSTLKSILYTSAFHLLPKEHVELNYPKPNFHIMTRGLGKSYIEKHKDYYVKTGRNVFNFGGFTFNLPPYIKNKLGIPSLYTLQSLDVASFKRDFYFSRSDKDLKSIDMDYHLVCDTLNNKLLKQGLKSKI